MGEINRDKEGNTWCNPSNNPKSKIYYIFFYRRFVLSYWKKIFLRKPPYVSNSRMSDHITFIFNCTIGKWIRRIHMTNIFIILSTIFWQHTWNAKKENDPEVRWEIIKYQFKKWCIEYSIKKKKASKPV